MSKINFLLFVMFFYSAGDGQIQWVQSTWGDQLFDFTVDKQGNSYVTGQGTVGTYQNITLNSSGGAYFAKYSSEGTILCATATQGADPWVVGQKIAADNNGNMYIVGQFSYEFYYLDSALMIGNLTIPINPGIEPNIFFVKLDNTGSPVWLKDIGGDNTNFVSDLTIDDSANLYLIGSYDTAFVLDGVSIGPTLNSDNLWGNFFLAKFDTNGNLLWLDTTICQSTSEVKVDKNGNLILAGAFQNTDYCFDTAFNAGAAIQEICIEKQSTTGSRKWIQHIKNNNTVYPYDQVIDFKIDTNNNLYFLLTLSGPIILSDSLINISSGNYLMKLDEAGVFQWINRIPTPQDTFNFSGLFIYLDRNDVLHCVASKYYVDTVYYYQSSSWTYNYYQVGLIDYKISNENGDTLSSALLQGVNMPWGENTELKNDGNDNLYIYGAFFDTISFDTTVLSSPFYGQYLLKYSNNITGIRNIPPNSPLLIAPNPADKYVYVEMGVQGDYEFSLFNMVGQLIDKKETRQADIFDTQHLASGVYFIKAIDKNSNSEVGVRKVVVEH